MQPIERYGLVALVFLGITISAAYFWEPEGDPAGKDPVANAARPEQRDYVGARTLDAQRGQPKALSAAKRQELLALQGRNAQQAAGGAPGGAGRALLGDARAPEHETGGAPLSDTRSELAQRSTAATAATAAAAAAAAAAKRSEAAPVQTRPTPQAALGTRIYEIQGNDTLSEIAMRELGTWTRWEEIVDLNPGLDPNHLRKGARIKLPAGKSVASGKPEALRASGEPAKAQAVGPMHVVQENESLWKIAALRLGKGERWGEIAALNPDVDPDRLKAGMKLVLPSGAGRTGGAAPADRALAQAEPSAQPTRGKVR